MSWCSGNLNVTNEFVVLCFFFVVIISLFYCLKIGPFPLFKEGRERREQLSRIAENLTGQLPSMTPEVQCLN